MFYKAVVQSVLLFGSETWVLSQPMLTALEGFHWRVARRIADNQPYLDRQTGEWVYPPIDKVLEEVGMYSIAHYIDKRQNTVADYVATRPIFDLCQGSEWLTGSRSSRRWWDQVDRVFTDEDTSDDGDLVGDS
jgi:L-rhamnose mutarotase